MTWEKDYKSGNIWFNRNVSGNQVTIVYGYRNTGSVKGELVWKIGSGETYYRPYKDLTPTVNIAGSSFSIDRI